MKDIDLRLTPYKQATQTQNAYTIYMWCRLVERTWAYMDAHAAIVKVVEEINSDDDDTAYVEYDGETFTVVLDPRLPVGMMTDYMIHELAHVASWHHDEKDDHGPEFGKAYAALYRHYLDAYDLFWNSP